MNKDKKVNDWIEKNIQIKNKKSINGTVKKQLNSFKFIDFIAYGLFAQGGIVIMYDLMNIKIHWVSGIFPILMSIIIAIYSSIRRNNKK